MVVFVTLLKGNYNDHRIFLKEIISRKWLSAILSTMYSFAIVYISILAFQVIFEKTLTSVAFCVLVWYRSRETALCKPCNIIFFKRVVKYWTQHWLEVYINILSHSSSRTFVLLWPIFWGLSVPCAYFASSLFWSSKLLHSKILFKVSAFIFSTNDFV